VSIWAPVVAALGTGVIGFGGILWQQFRRDRRATLAEKSDAYYQLIAHSLSFAVRAGTMQNTMRVRSGLNERMDLTLRLRRPLDPMEVHDWFAQGYEPMNQAWSKIQVVGSVDAVRVAKELMDACADMVALAGELGGARGPFGTYLRGLEWTSDQEEALKATTNRMIEHREALIELARKDLGHGPVPSPKQA
jgi:hypothetical protein